MGIIFSCGTKSVEFLGLRDPAGKKQGLISDKSLTWYWIGASILYSPIWISAFLAV